MFAPENIPNIALVIVGITGIVAAICTLKVIERQTAATEQSADAAKQSADALINSERAWLAVSVEMPNPPYIHIVWINVPITNHGKTTARVKKIVVAKKLIPFPSDNTLGRPGELPAIPEYDANTVTLERDIIIAPDSTLQHMHIEIWPTDLARVHAREVSLYVYGLVEYLDTVKGLEHKICFCFIYWVPEQGWDEPTGFMFSPIIPPAYFCAT